MSDSPPWYLEPWRPLLNRKIFAERMIRTPLPLSNLHLKPAQQAYDALDDALGDVFVACQQSIDLGEVIVATAVHHLTKRYTDGEQDYLRRVNSRVINHEPEFIPPIPITGHAGVGKSSIIRAISRAIGSPTRVKVGGLEIMPVPFAMVPVGIAKSQLAVVRRLGVVGKNLEDCCASAQRILYRNATGILSFGELQFVNQSSTANTLVAGILLQAGYLGVPSAYDANFSLMWRLRKRPPEERDRLLENPIVIFPDVPGSQDAIAISQAMLAVAPGIFEIDLNADGLELDVRSGGLRRMKRRLLSLAYLIKRRDAKQSEVRVSIDDIRSAYQSNLFKDSRLTIEELARRQDRSRDNKEDDLCCPFDEPRTAAQARDQANCDFRNSQVAENEFLAALSAKEKKNLALQSERKVTQRRSQASSRASELKPKTKNSDRALNSAALAAELAGVNSH